MATLAELLAKKKAETKAEEKIETKVEIKAEEPSGMEVLAKAVEAEKEKSIDTLLDMPLGFAGTVDAEIAKDAKITVDDILPRIRALSSLAEIDTIREMDRLKEALLANPEAVNLMQPEDVGELVKALRRITKEAVVTAEKAKSTKTKASSKTTSGIKPITAFTAEELANADDF